VLVAQPLSCGTRGSTPLDPASDVSASHPLRDALVIQWATRQGDLVLALAAGNGIASCRSQPCRAEIIPSAWRQANAVEPESLPGGVSESKRGKRDAERNRTAVPVLGAFVTNGGSPWPAEETSSGQEPKEGDVLPRTSPPSVSAAVIIDAPPSKIPETMRTPVTVPREARGAEKLTFPGLPLGSHRLSKGGMRDDAVKLCLGAFESRAERLRYPRTVTPNRRKRAPPRKGGVRLRPGSPVPQ
jgi:hypothetical protein